MFILWGSILKHSHLLDCIFNEWTLFRKNLPGLTVFSNRIKSWIWAGVIFVTFFLWDRLMWTVQLLLYVNLALHIVHLGTLMKGSGLCLILICVLYRDCRSNVDVQCLHFIRILMTGAICPIRVFAVWYYYYSTK